jgi:caffeoyl-CoA O-methyltransferase
MADTRETPWADPAVTAYVRERSAPPDDLQRRLIAETHERLPERAQMQISAHQGAVMTMLVQLMGATNAIEIGTFTGHSALCIARGLPDDGRLLCCDVSEEWTAIGRRYWDEAGVGDRIELRIGPAIDTLRSLPAAEQFDVAFIDADKPSYLAYVEELLPRLRHGGLIMVDNTLWSGEVADDGTTNETAQFFRKFNDAVAADPRLTCVILPIGDGLTLLRRR